MGAEISMLHEESRGRMRLPTKRKGDVKEGAGQENGRASVLGLALWGFGKIPVPLRAVESRTRFIPLSSTAL